MNYFDDFIDDFSELIAEELMPTLSDELTNEYANNSAKAIVSRLNQEHEERYLLVSGETGQLASRMLYETSLEALDMTKQEQYRDCLVAVLLIRDFPC